MTITKTDSNREVCLEFTLEAYFPWPEAHHTGHTGVAHYGYSWEQISGGDEWVLTHEYNGDVITKDDQLELFNSTRPNRGIGKVYRAVDLDDKVVYVLWSGVAFLIFGSSEEYHEQEFKSVGDMPCC